MDYRKLYKDKLGDIPRGYDIHHLDHNRANNNISNLVAIPKKLHQKYHYYISMFREGDKLTKIIPKGMEHINIGFFRKQYDDYCKYLTLCEHINYFVSVRDYNLLDKKLGNPKPSLNFNIENYINQ